MTTEPTDAELIAELEAAGVVFMAFRGGLSGTKELWTTSGSQDAKKIAAGMRAAIAKWGSSPAVAGEPVAWLSTDSIGERYLCFTKPNDSDPVRPLVFGDTTPQPTQAQAGAGTWAHLKLMMEESAWDGTLHLSDALANIDDFAAANPSPPEGMVGGWIALPDAVRVPLDSLHADAAYLIGRLQRGTMTAGRVVEVIRERIDAARARLESKP